MTNPTPELRASWRLQADQLVSSQFPTPPLLREYAARVIALIDALDEREADIRTRAKQAEARLVRIEEDLKISTEQARADFARLDEAAARAVRAAGDAASRIVYRGRRP